MATVTRLQPKKAGPKPAKSASGPKRPSASPKKSQPPASGRLDDNGWFGTPPFSIVHYGPPGVGKTSMWAFMEDVGFLFDNKEDGITDLYKVGQVPKPKWEQEVEDFDQTLETLARIANQEFDIKNLVIDSITGFEAFCFTHHCQEHFDNDWSKDGFLAFQQGPKNAAATDWPKLLDAIDAVRKSGISTVFIGHSTIKKINNPEGDDYDQYMPVIDRATWAQTTRWAKAIIFQNYDISLEKKGLKTKASGGTDRMIYTVPQAACIAKNRWGLDPIINCGGSPEESFNAFVEAYKAAWKID